MAIKIIATIGIVFLMLLMLSYYEREKLDKNTRIGVWIVEIIEILSLAGIWL